MGGAGRDREPRVGVTATIRGPVEDTLRWVRYHRAIGAELVVVVLDDPLDPAFEILSRVDGVLPIRGDAEHRVRVGVPADASIEARLHANAEFGFRMARERSCDWSVTLDGDELLHVPAGLARTLGQVPSEFEVARFPVMEAVPDRLEHADPFHEVTTFRRVPTRRQATLSRLLGCGAAFFGGDFLRGHLMGKAAVRTTAEVIAMRSHAPVLASGSRQAARLADAWVLHYDCTSLTAFKRKWSWRLDGSAPATRLRPARQAQADAYAEAVASDPSGVAVEKLFRRLYFLSGRQRATLRTLGMLPTVHLDPSLFRD